MPTVVTIFGLAHGMVEPQYTMSFFLDLNFDVRLLIYSFSNLPPISRKAIGLILSCRQARDEIEYEVSRQVNTYLFLVENNARAKLHAPVELPTFPTNTIFTALTDVTVYLPFYLIHATAELKVAEQYEIIRECVTLPPLLLWLGTVKLVFRAEKDLTARFTPIPDFSGALEMHRPFHLRYNMNWCLHLLMFIVCSDIQLMEPEELEITQIGERQPVDPPIRRKRVILQWDMLVGEQELLMRNSDKFFVTSAADKWIRYQDYEPNDDYFAVAIRRWSTNGLLGELEIFSPKRFRGIPDGCLTRLLTGPRLSKNDKFWNWSGEYIEVMFSTQTSGPEAD
jgi:hypothetical protein